MEMNVKSLKRCLPEKELNDEYINMYMSLLHVTVMSNSIVKCVVKFFVIAFASLAVWTCPLLTPDNKWVVSTLI